MQAWHVYCEAGSGKYRVHTKEWCGFPLFTIETAPFFCVYPVYYLKRLQIINCVTQNLVRVWNDPAKCQECIVNND
jgi:hypothetical protein